ncbi:arylsulfotransferase family protein [Streptomyces sp. NPDC050529]|uniref:arylsulfotransferase family protein n=1 Tax=Streptomyces sp. NPDC050529 TaxID=3365624 RepID=UPI0037B37632
MTQLISDPPPAGDEADCFVYSPASSYPTPYARLVDRKGAEIHTWSHTAAQFPESDNPPSFLRGWSHVEVDPDGCLFAMVPLRALIKLAPDSTLLWQADIPAHHDLALLPGGGILALAGSPRRIVGDGFAATVLDNTIAELDADGGLIGEVSLYDILATEPALASMIRRKILTRQGEFIRACGAPSGEVGRLFETGSFTGPVTRAIAQLRQLRGSPCDILHTNTLEVLPAHPAGLWARGGVLVSMRDLDLIAVVDPNALRVLWWWGPGEVSGQHQPSMLPNGNLLVLDNGSDVGRSRVLEVDPRTGAIVWEYGTRPDERFFTEVAGGCERLPNGNILVSDALSGRAFEVTSTGRTVWHWETRKEAGSGTSRATFYRLSRISGRAAARLLQADRKPDVGPPAPPVHVGHLEAGM